MSGIAKTLEKRVKKAREKISLKKMAKQVVIPKIVGDGQMRNITDSLKRFSFLVKIGTKSTSTSVQGVAPKLDHMRKSTLIS